MSFLRCRRVRRRRSFPPRAESNSGTTSNSVVFREGALRDNAMVRSKGKHAVCAEKQLLVSCARTRMAPEIAERIREITAQAARLGFCPQRSDRKFSRAIAGNESAGRGAGVRRLPAAMERLKITCRANTVRCLFLSGGTAQDSRIVSTCRDHGDSLQRARSCGASLREPDAA